MKCRDETTLDPIAMQNMCLSKSPGFKYNWEGEAIPLEALWNCSGWWSRNISIKLPKGLPIVELLGCVLRRLFMGYFQSWVSHHTPVSF